MPRRGPGGHGMRFEKPKDFNKALRRLARYFVPYKNTLLVVVLLVVIYTLASLAGPYLLGVAIDRYIIPGDLPGLARISLIMLGAYLFSSLLQALSGWLMAGATQRAMKGLRTRLFSQLQKLSLHFFDRNPAGDLMSRLTNDINAMNQVISQNVTSLVANVLSLAGILITMFVLNFWLSIAALVVVPIMLLFTTFVAKYTRKGFQRLQKQLGSLNSTIEEHISGQKIVKAFRRSESAERTFEYENQETYEAGVYANTYAFLIMPLTFQLGNLFIIVLVVSLFSPILAAKLKGK